LTELSNLQFQLSAERSSTPLTLRSVTRLPDLRVAVVYDGKWNSGELVVTDGHHFHGLRNQQTANPFPVPDEGAIVWLADTEGRELSNRVPIDDPARLDSMLERRAESADRIPDLDLRDIQTPVGRMLARLHRECIFDIDRTPAASRAYAGSDEQTEDPAFWDRFLREELSLDPRVERYRRFGLGQLEDDDILAMLR